MHPKLGAARAEVRLAGRATAACSPRCEAGGVLSLDWHAPGAEMRIQVDRVFADASGAIASLEITDVLADQAERTLACTRHPRSYLSCARARGARSLSLLLGARAGGP